MNTVQLKNNSKKNGDLFDRSKKIAKDKAKSVEPSISQLKYRDALYKFLVDKGIVGHGFRVGRTKQAIRSSIRSLLTLLEKHGLDEEFFGKEKENDNG